MSTFLLALTTTYGAVLVSEIIGDRSMYTIAGLSARFGARPVMTGVFPAFMLKSLAAVLLGAAVLSRMPPGVIALLSAATFCSAAVHLWRAKEITESATSERELPSRGIAAAFATIFFTEWADIGQITTAMMVARFDAPYGVWLAATAALMTKAGLCAWAGAPIARRVDSRRLRWGVTSLLVVMGVLALLRID